MKKLMIASAIAMTMAAGSAMAAQGEIQFFGNVSETTCDIAPEVNGSVNNIVQLGTATKNGKGPEVIVKFKAKDATDVGCTALTGKSAEFAWAGNLTGDGIGAQGGAATDAYVKLVPVDVKAGNQDDPITASKNTAVFDAEKITNGAGVEFKAQLHGKNEVGDFTTAAAYAVTYK